MNGRILDALCHAMHKAASLVDQENFGGELRGHVRHARELREILLGEMTRSDTSWEVDELRTVCEETGASLDYFESLIAEARPSGAG